MAPTNKEQFQALTSEDVKPTEAHISLAKFLSEFGPVEVSPEQAWSFIMGHRVWQGSEERAAEKIALKESRATEAEAARAKRETEKAEKAAAKEIADKEKAERKAEREAAAAAKAAGDDSDIDSADSPAPKRRRPAAPAKAETATEGVSAGSI